ncbi:Uncharacterized protein Fot_32370 [Forsythia ovata]|uniref:Uncharacterized protein n=1 Tax=Forsythia ovata TaxID=205694 RepID=A0ABD1T7L6_9LAMI
MGPDSRGRNRCFGRATFLEKSLNNTSNRGNAEVRNLKRKVVDVEEKLKRAQEELKNTRQQCYDLISLTNALQASMKTIMDELVMMRGNFDSFLLMELARMLTDLLYLGRASAVLLSRLGVRTITCRASPRA